jgi:CheY-like chemotaxis protein
LALSTPRIGRALAQRQLKEHPDAILRAEFPKGITANLHFSRERHVMIRTIQKRTVLALLVEANGLVRLELNRALEQEHFEVLWTTTTQEAVAAYNRRHIDLLLLDLNQPVKVGWDIFEPVGSLNPALPIVMVTEKKTELELTVADRVGAQLEKPFSLPALIQTIHLLLGQPTQTHLQVSGGEPISNHLCPSGRISSQPRSCRSFSVASQEGFPTYNFEFIV